MATNALDARERLSEAEAASQIGVSTRTLQKLRNDGKIGYLTIGLGTVRPRISYTQRHIDDFLDSREVQPTTRTRRQSRRAAS